MTNHRLLSRSNSRTNKSTSRRQSTDWARDSVWSCSKQEEWSLSWGKGRVVVSILYFCRYRQFVQGVLFGEHDRESTMDSSDEEFVPPVIEEDKVFMVRCLHDSLTNVEFLRERLMKSNLYEFICILRPRMHLFLNPKVPIRSRDSLPTVTPCMVPQQINLNSVKIRSCSDCRCKELFSRPSSCVVLS